MQLKSVSSENMDIFVEIMNFSKFHFIFLISASSPHATLCHLFLNLSSELYLCFEGIWGEIKF